MYKYNISNESLILCYQIIYCDPQDLLREFKEGSNSDKNQHNFLPKILSTSLDVEGIG